MRKITCFTVFILILGLAGLFSVAGLALNADQTAVIDDAQIFGNKIGDIEAAAGKLTSLGADIRVRTISTFGSSGNLDQYEAQLEKQSTSWVDSNGERKNNLIVLIITLQERQTGLYYGAYWDGILNDQWLRIQTEIMNPLFRNGDYAGGTTRGLAEIQRLIQPKPQTQAASQPLNSSNGWIFPIVLVALILIVIGLFLFINYRKKLARRQAARQKALLPKQAAASGINELNETLQLLEIKVNVMAAKVASDEAALLNSGLAKARGLVNQSSLSYSELSHSAGDPENPRLDVPQLVVIQGEYQKIVDNLRLARESIKGVEEQISGIQQAVDSVPGKLTDISTAIEEALKKQAELKSAGFKTDYPADLVTKGRDTLAQAQDLVNQKRVYEAAKYFNLAADQIKQAIQAAAELPRKKQEAVAAIPGLSSRIEQVKEKIVSGRVVFERLFQDYAESTWQSVRGNGTEAENRVNWALDALGDAGEAVATEQQDWYKALEYLEKGNLWLNETEALMNSISELETNLIAARRDAPGEISDVQADIDKAWEYINRYDEDIRESLEDDLRAAQKKNDLAREELKQARPDYFTVCKLAREAHEATDKILIQARDEHEGAERLRAKATSARRDAGARVSIAKTYVEVHHPVVRGEARDQLITAIEALRQADSALDSSSQIALAVKAESAADQAYLLAQRDVNSTTMNIPNIGRPGMGIPTIIIPPMGHRPGSNQSWGSRQSGNANFGIPRMPGGGGSSSWGSRGGGFGGGGGRKGGGSSGW
jgi:uncharacterized membrane protein YgcG